MSLNCSGNRKLYVVFMTRGGLYASAVAEIDSDITVKAIDEIEKAAAQSIGAKPEDIIILNWKILEG